MNGLVFVEYYFLFVFNLFILIAKLIFFSNKNSISSKQVIFGHYTLIRKYDTTANLLLSFDGWVLSTKMKKYVLRMVIIYFSFLVKYT